MTDKLVRSPDGRFEAALEWAGEIRFGPAYYRLILQRRTLADRIFGPHLVWSADSRYLLVEEWQSTNPSQGPRTQLVAFDLQFGRECVLSQATDGFIEPLGFEGDLVRYRKSYFADGKIIDYDQDLPPVERWVPCRVLTPRRGP